MKNSHKLEIVTLRDEIEKLNKIIGQQKNENEELNLDKEFIRKNYRNALDEISRLKGEVK